MAREATIYITEQDRDRLENLISLVRDSNERTNISYVTRLAEELDFAEIVAPENIRQDVVTMRSKVKLTDLDTNEESVYTIVFPTEANIADGKISILAPLATALLGHRLGDAVEFKAPSGIKRLRIEGILYQPESAGDFEL